MSEQSKLGDRNVPLFCAPELLLFDIAPAPALIIKLEIPVVQVNPFPVLYNIKIVL